MEADGRCRRLSPGLRRGARGIVRRPRGRLRPSHRRRYEASCRRCTAVGMVDRLIELSAPRYTDGGRWRSRPMRLMQVETGLIVLGRIAARRIDRAQGEMMPDIAIAEIPVDQEERPLPPPSSPVRNALVDGPILRTLLRLAWPNVIALSAGTCVVIAETSYIGRLGVESLAAMALVFPFVILTMTMSGGAMGGGVSWAIARALGAVYAARAAMLASHAMLIGLTFGLAFTLVMLLFGRTLLQLLGGRGNVLAQATGYIQIFFGGVVIAWLMNTLGGILRGTGNMKLPSLIVLGSALCQIIL